MTPEGKPVISPRSPAILPTNSLSKGSLVTIVSVLDFIGSEVTARKYNPSWSRTMSRKLPFTKLGRVRDVPLNSLHSGNGLSAYQAQTWRRDQAGSRLRNPESDSAAGLSPRSRRAASSLLTAALGASRLLNWGAILV